MASITFEGPDGTERIDGLASDAVWYRVDTHHWVVRVGTTARGEEVVRHIPERRVYAVETEQPPVGY